jgi:hypothetical protein
MPDPKPMPQVTTFYNRPLLSVRDRMMLLLRARGGHGRRGPTALRPGGDGHKLNRRVKLVHDNHLPHWQAPRGGAAVRVVLADSARIVLAMLGSPRDGEDNRDRQDGVSHQDHHHTDGQALEVRPAVVVVLDGIT